MIEFLSYNLLMITEKLSDVMTAYFGSIWLDYEWKIIYILGMQSQRQKGNYLILPKTKDSKLAQV